MPAIIPIPAFTDNYLWILREGRGLRLPTVPSPIADERVANPFLCAGEPAVSAAADVRAGRKLADAVDAFAAPRGRKNKF
jgi:hydroxyacylglutathione hydrolase